MKKYYLFTFLLILATSLSTFGQKNEKSADLYDWKNNKTNDQDGYVVLKSGKKLVGKISLKGSPNSVSEIHYVGDGKDIKFPAASLASYGLNISNKKNNSNVSQIVNDSDEDLYKWGVGATVMGKFQQTTKPKSGYVITKQGTKLEGQLQLKKVDEVLSEIKLKTDSDKYSLIILLIVYQFF